MPTRLLSIRYNPIRLCSSNTRQERNYAPLIHCWGSKPEILLKLTEENIDELHQSIPLQRLSRTFKEAIYIALELGLDYIWIDSLCIIQDDAEDWRRESTLMGQVYGNSFINIAASSAIDGSYGCFMQRRGPSQCSHTLRVKINHDPEP